MYLYRLIFLAIHGYVPTLSVPLVLLFEANMRLPRRQECKYPNTVKVPNFYLISDFVPERKEYSHYVKEQLFLFLNAYNHGNAKL